MARGLALGGFLAIAVALTGCGGSLTHDIEIDLAPTTGALALDVENFRGPIEIRADPRYTTPSIRGVVTVTEDADKARKKMILDAVDVSASIEEVDGRGILRVRAETARERYDDHKTSLAIYVPRCDGLRVVNSGGDVIVVNGGGAAEVTNREGAIVYRTNRIVTDPVVLTTVDGNIYLQIAGGSMGSLDLQTLEGIVRYRDKIGEDIKPTTIADNRFVGVLNSGANPIVGRSNRGDVSVWLQEDPVSLIHTNRAWNPPLQDRLFLQTTRRYTRNLPDDHPEVTGESPRAAMRGLGMDYE